MLSKLVVLAMLLAGALSGCGRAGFPAAPDDYGIGLRMQQERQKEEQARREQAREAAAAKQKADEGLVPPPDEITLPEMRPVGGR